MRFYYLDAGLIKDANHHANYCRYIVGEARARGLETLVFANSGIEAAPRSELAARPHFRVYTYREREPDPICGWLTGFERAADIIYEDLTRMPAPKAGDLVFMSSVSPAQLRAMDTWMTKIPPARRPGVVLEMGGTGLRPGGEPLGRDWQVPHPFTDPRPMLFRYTSLGLRRQQGTHLNFISFTPTLANLFSNLLQIPVHVVPFPYRAVTPLRNRAGARPAVVAILGHQKVRKGYDKLPELVARLLQARADIRLLVQVVDPMGAPEAIVALRNLAAGNDRLILSEQAAGREGWPQLLEKSDLILCAYRPEFHLASFSAVAAEAIANGIPVVLPGGTPMATLLEECGGGGGTFDRFGLDEITAAVERVLDNFDHYATLAHAGGLTWPNARGPARLLDAVMTLVQRDNRPETRDNAAVAPSHGRNRSSDTKH